MWIRALHAFTSKRAGLFAIKNKGKNLISKSWRGINSQAHIVYVKTHDVFVPVFYKCILVFTKTP